MNIYLKRIIAKTAGYTGLDISFLKLRDFWWRRHKTKEYLKIAKTGKVDLPVSLTLALTMRCNLRCFMCFQSRYRESERKRLAQKELSARQWTSFLEKSKPFIKRVGLTGGEIFVRGDVFEILDSLEKFKIPFNILTNGVLIDGTKANRLASYKFLDTLCFSVHGLRKTHDEIVGVEGSFEKVTKAIKLVSRNHFWVAVNCTISDKNLKELPRLVKFSAMLGVDSIGFQLENFATPREEEKARQLLKGNPLSGFAQSKKSKTYPYSFSSLMKTWTLVRKIGRVNGIPTSFTPPVFYFDPKAVYLGNIEGSRFKLFCDDLLGCRIDPEGNVIACQFLPQRFGNIRDQSIRRIWSSSQFKAYRRRLLDNNLMPICNRCCKVRRFSGCGV